MAPMFDLSFLFGVAEFDEPLLDFDLHTFAKCPGLWQLLHSLSFAGHDSPSL